LKNSLIEINDFKGGATLNEKMGNTDQFHIGTNLDFGSKAGYLTCGYGWTNMQYSSSINMPTEFQCMLHAMKDGNFYLGGEDTKLYKMSSTGEIDVAVDSDQPGIIRSLAEYYGYLYYIQDTTLGRSDLAGTPNYDHDWQTGLTTADYHSLFISADGKLYGGHGQYIFSYNNTTFTPSALDLADYWKVRCLADFGYLYLAIGANYYAGSERPQKSKIFLWDRVSTTWQDEIIIPENEIKAMWFASGYLWVIAGRSCNIYVVPEGSRKATKVWTFVKEDPNQEIEVYPNAILSRGGTIYFALSNVDILSYIKNPAGIYSFPTEPDKFSLNLVRMGGAGGGYKEKWKSLGMFREVAGTGGDVLFAGWRNYQIVSSEYNRLSRENLFNETTPYDYGIYYSFRYEAPKNKKLFTDAFGVIFDPLPAGCSLDLYVSRDIDVTNVGVGTWINTSGWQEIFSTMNIANTREKIIYKRLEGNSLQLKLTITPSSTTKNRPFIKSLYVTGSLKSKVK